MIELFYDQCLICFSVELFYKVQALNCYKYYILLFKSEFFMRGNNTMVHQHLNKLVPNSIHRLHTTVDWFQRNRSHV